MPEAALVAREVGVRAQVATDSVAVAVRVGVRAGVVTVVVAKEAAAMVVEETAAVGMVAG